MPNCSSKTILSIFALASHVGSFGVGASTLCIPPTGLEDLPAGVADGISAVLAGGELPYLWLPQAEPFIGELTKGYEAPVQFRFAQIHGSRIYNVAAKYHPIALDIWGKDTHRICQDGDNEYLNLHEEIALAYAFYYSSIEAIPQCEEILKPVFESMGLSASLLDGSDPDPSTPWGLAKITIDEYAASVVNDGWNADGKLGAEFNPLPYSDFSIQGQNGVVYNPYVVEAKRNNDNWPWQPLVDSDGRGFFSKQEHVTPFIGYTGRLYGMDEDHYQSFTAPPPKYNYEVEAEELLERTRIMASSDLQKMKIEYYNSKFTSILPLQINWSIASGASEFEFWFNDMVLVNTMYDAILLVWKEKIAHNAVRPTTVVHRLFGDEVFDTYAGPFMGSNMIKAGEWQPYVRTMPHAEYPSGSACVCTAYAETLQELTGTDEIGFPLTQFFDAGSSKTEKGVTPSENVTLVYNKWSDIAYDCGQSRLYGGMHFEASVSAANDLCSGFINPVVANARLLEVGDSSGALAQGPITLPSVCSDCKVKDVCNNNESCRWRKSLRIYGSSGTCESRPFEPEDDEDDTSPCDTSGIWHLPLNMANQGRTVADPAGCQQRCKDTPGCKYFNSFPDGGCHVTTGAKGTKKQKGNPTELTGSSTCTLGNSNIFVRSSVSGITGGSASGSYD